MTTTELQNFILEAVEERAMNYFRRVATFEEAGYLTTDDGIVLGAQDGTTFEITIVKRGE